MNKKLFFIIVLCFALVFAGCGKQGGDEPTPANQPGQQEQPTEPTQPAQPEGGSQEEDKKVFEPLVGSWYNENLTECITIYENGGFYLRQVTDDIYGYLVYTEEKSPEGITGPHFDLYLENNERLDYSCLVQDEKYPGTLTYEQGMGAEILTRRDYVSPMEMPLIEWVYAYDRKDSGLTDGFDSYVAVESDYPVEVVFNSLRDVDDFTLCKVSMRENGSWAFDPVNNFGTLKSNQPLVITLDFPGDMPSYGITYTDPWTFVTHQRLVAQSGYDGSIEMMQP